MTAHFSPTWVQTLGHALIGARPRLLLRLFTHYGVDPKYRLRAMRVFALSLLSAPLPLLERLLYGRALRKVELPVAPVFIVGHWRSGTTHLHNLLTQDARFGSLTYAQALFANFSLLRSRLHAWLLRRMLPATRPMDEMAMSPDGPAEEEFALACMGDVSALNGVWFPRQLEKFISRTVLFEAEDGSPDPNALAEWQRQYVTLAKKLAWLNPERQLVLKSPANTGRIAALLQLFPRARFIHIVRSPYEVYPSTLRLYEKLMAGGAFQTIADADLQSAVLRIYSRLMRRYLRDSALIPSGQLYEVRYEELIENPLPALRAMYTNLSLGDFNTARPALESYLQRVRDYRRSRYAVLDDHSAAVDAQWGEVLARWNYAAPQANP